MSQIDENHDRLAENRIGALAIGVLEFQVKRHNSRGGVAFSDEQERLITLCLDILNNLGDSPMILNKMIKRDIVSLLVVFVRLRSPTAIVLTLSLLRSASIYEETAAALSAEGCQVGAGVDFELLSKSLTFECPRNFHRSYCS